MSRERAISPMGTGWSEPRRASSESARTAYGDFEVIASTGASARLWACTPCPGGRALAATAALMALIFALSAMPGHDFDGGPRLARPQARSLPSTPSWCACGGGRCARLPARIAAGVASRCPTPITDELHQLIVEGRKGTPPDVLIDTAGALRPSRSSCAPQPSGDRHEAHSAPADRVVAPDRDLRVVRLFRPDVARAGGALAFRSGRLAVVLGGVALPWSLVNLLLAQRAPARREPGRGSATS